MQKDDILEFLTKIDLYLNEKLQTLLAGKSFELKIFGKSALMLAGLSDSIGTNDIDVLRIGVQGSFTTDAKITKNLEIEFGRSRIKVYGYYLEFVNPAIVFLSQQPKWVPGNQTYQCLYVKYLDPGHVIASKLFSAFSSIKRKQDLQDVIAALDQGLVSLNEVCRIADAIFDFHMMDSRSDRFPTVYEYITKTLFIEYGDAPLNYHPED